MTTMADSDKSSLFEVCDYLVVAGYFVLLIGVGIWSLCRVNRGTVRNYFLAGRNMSWIPVGASLFASNIGTEHFIGLAGTGAAAGISIIIYEWLSMPLILCLGWLFTPVYVSSGATTMPEYMQRRFGGQRIRIYLSLLALVVYILVKLAPAILGGALFIQMALGWSLYPAIAFLLVVTAFFTILGGLTTVMYTDTFQTAILIAGSIVLSAMSFYRIGGYSKLEEVYMTAVPAIRHANSTCGIPREDSFRVLRDPVNSDNPWPGIVLHILFACMWYWCNDQVIVQRTLAAKTLSHAKAGSLLTGYLKILPLFVMVMPGMISRALFPDEVACVDPDECMKYCGNKVGCSNTAYPKLVLEILPSGLRGLQVAVMLAAIIGSLTSIFNSASTIFTMDLWTRIRNSASEKERLVVGRLFIVVMCVLSVAWLPLVQTSHSGQLFIYINAIMGYLASPISALFLVGVLWGRMTEPAAFWSLLLAQGVGMVRLVMEFILPEPFCGEPETRPAVLFKVHYTYFCVMLYFLTVISIFVISMVTKPKENVEGLTWWTIKEGLNKSKDTTEEQHSTNVFTISEKDASVESPQTDNEQSIPKIGKAKKIIYRICGVPIVSQAYHSEDMDLEYKRHFLTENKVCKAFLNVNAAVALAVITFLIGYFS